IVQFRKFEHTRLSESHNVNPFSMLWNDGSGINCLIVYKISKLILQGFHDYPKCFTFVMSSQIFHIFEDKRFRTLLGNYSCDIEKERALRSVFKPMCVAKGIMFGYACNTERLTWKPCR